MSSLPGDSISLCDIHLFNCSIAMCSTVIYINDLNLNEAGCARKKNTSLEMEITNVTYISSVRLGQLYKCLTSSVARASGKALSNDNRASDLFTTKGIS